MTGIRYLGYETVVDINAEHGGKGAGVRDEAGIRAALGRVEASFGGHDLYPTLEQKAAVILHGLSSTQYFHDGNKRTAWIAAKLFLALNGHHLNDPADIDAESIVLAVATKAFETPETPERGIDKAADWYTARCLTMRDRCGFAFLADDASWDHDRSLLNVNGGLLSAATTWGYPTGMQAAIVVHILWRRVDAGRSHTISVDTDDPEILEVRSGAQEVALSAIELSSHPLLGMRPVMPLTFVIHCYLISHQLGNTKIRVLIDDEEFASLPFAVLQEVSIPDHPPES